MTGASTLLCFFECHVVKVPEGVEKKMGGQASKEICLMSDLEHFQDPRMSGWVGLYLDISQHVGVLYRLKAELHGM
jgi:hypothetical protein